MDLLPFIVAGLATGAIYGLAGVGLVLTYKTSGVFNFAHGSLATVSAYVFYSLHVQHHIAWPAAAFVAIFVVGPMLGVILERIATALGGASLTASVVSTVGLLLIVQSVVVIIYGTVATRNVPQFLPHHPLNILGATVTTASLILFGVAALATLLLALYFRWARTGVAMRAVVDGAELLDLSGTNPTAVRRRSWVIGVTFAAASGVLLAPLISLNATTLTFLVVQAFGAAAIGAFSSLSLTFTGGLVVGVASALASKYFTSGVLSGLPPALPFIILFIVLLLSPRGRLAALSNIQPRRKGNWRMPWRLQSVPAIGLCALFLVVPSFAGVHLTDWTICLSYVVLLLSLGLLVRTSGQVSLCHVSFMAIGAVAFSHLNADHHWPWIAALLMAGLIAVPIGALLAIPAIRLSGLYLALATFGFGILLQYMFYAEPYMFGPNDVGLTMPKPKLSWLGVSSASGFYYLLLAIAILVALVVVSMDRSRLGRLLRAMADSPSGLAATGTSVNVTRVLVFCLSAFIAAIAGALNGISIGVASGDSYMPLQSLLFFAAIIITVGGEPWYAVWAAAGLTLIPSYVPSPTASNYLQLAFGVGALLYALAPDGTVAVPTSLREWLDRVGRRPAASTPSATPDAAEPGTSGLPIGALTVSGLNVRFGGIAAVVDARLSARPGQITGLIGPNGAGKTTTFNACSGDVRPSSGRIEYAGSSLAGLGPSARARKGLGRTFQQMKLFESLTVAQNVMMGVEGNLAGAHPFRHLTSTRRQRQHAENAAHQALTTCGLLDLANATVGDLSTGHRRFVELARCLAGPFQILLLDEPSSGLDRVETERFGAILKQVVKDRGVGILLIEHDMSLVTSVCDYLYVMDFGQSIFEGTPLEAVSSEVVRRAYLGELVLQPSS